MQFTLDQTTIQLAVRFAFPYQFRKPGPLLVKRMSLIIPCNSPGYYRQYQTKRDFCLFFDLFLYLSPRSEFCAIRTSASTAKKA